MNGIVNVNFESNDGEDNHIDVRSIIINNEDDLKSNHTHFENPVFKANPSFISTTESSKTDSISNHFSVNVIETQPDIIKEVPHEVETDEKKKKKEKKKGTSNTETLMHIIKANIGTGVLAMPLAFRHAGLIFGSIWLWIMAVICVHCMHILLDTYKHVMVNYSSSKDTKLSESIGYDDVVKMLIKEKSPPGSRWAKISKFVVSVFLVIGQLGFCCVYLVFIPTNIKQVIDIHTPDGLSVQVLMCIILGPLICFCMIKDLKILAPFSTFANFLMIGSMLVILGELFFSGTPFKSFDELDMVAPVNDWPLYFSCAIYAFEGISLVLPVYNEMRNKGQFSTWNGVLNTGMTLVAVMYFAIGFFGYFKYGIDCEASITLNLPNAPVFQAVRILFSLAIFISYNLQFYVAAEIIWNYIFRASKYLQSLAAPIDNSLKVDLDNEKLEKIIVLRSSPKKLYFIELGFRALLVLFTFALAILIPRIDLFISLVGAVASSTLAIIIPPFLEFIIIWNTPRRTFFRISKNIFIILFGIYIFAAGTYVSVRDIVEFFVNN